MSEQVKPFSDAEREYLLALNTQAQQSQAALENFLVFLRKQHEAPAPEWQLRNINVGFERMVQKPPQGDKPDK